METSKSLILRLDKRMSFGTNCYSVDSYTTGKGSINTNSSSMNLYNFTCTKCQKPFIFRHLLVNHLFSHTDNINPPSFICVSCNHIYQTESELDFHKTSHNSQRYIREISLTRLQCSICTKLFSSRHFLIKHLFYHYTNIYCPLYICSTCSETFASAPQLEQHSCIVRSLQLSTANESEKQMETEEQQNFLSHCISLKSENWPQNLKSEFIIFEDNNNYNGVPCPNDSDISFVSSLLLKCAICLEDFLSINLLTVHVFSHTDHIYAPSTQNSLASHKAIEVDNGLSELSLLYFKCACCVQIFVSRCSLIAHIFCHITKVHHPRYICTQCCVVFPAFPELKLHSCDITSMPNLYERCMCEQDSTIIQKQLLISSTGDSINTQTTKMYSSNTVGKSFRFKKHMNLNNISTCVKCGKSTNWYMGSALFGIHWKKISYNCDIRENMEYPYSNTKIHQETFTNKNKFICNICGKLLANSESLKYHLKTHSGERSYVCNICEKSFVNSSGLKSHKRTHSAWWPFACEICGRRFKDPQNVKRHQIIHTSKKQFVCNVCRKSFKHRVSLKSHMLLHTDGRHFPCKFCGKELAHPSGLRKHERTHSDERPYICNVCGKRFRQSGHLQTHVRIHTGERPFTCSICDRSFRQDTGLKNHERIHFGSKPFGCNICGKTFAQSGSLKSHEIIHSSKRPFACGVCQKKFASQDALKKHSIMHSDECPFVCNVCGKTFKRSGNFRQHQMTHTGTILFPCNVCGKMFKDSSYIKVHQRIHSGEKPYACKFCDKTFSQRSSCKSHQRLHTNDRPFVCGDCGNSYTTSSSLKEHKKNHSSDKPFECNICNMSFVTVYRLKHHQKIHNGAKPFSCRVCGRMFNQKGNLKRHGRIHSG